MMYEEKKEIRKQISQMLADAGLNQGTIKSIVEVEIKNRAERAISQTLESLNAQCSSGDYIQEQVNKYLKSEYMNSYACTEAIKRELTNKIISITLKDVALSKDDE